MSAFLFYTFRIIIISFRYKRREIMKRTYPSWLEGQLTSKQTEYTKPTKLLATDGKLLSPGWARHNVFDYERDNAKPAWRKKEWDFYQISNGEFMVQISFANISIGGYAQASITDLHNAHQKSKIHSGTILESTALFLGGKKYILPPKGDEPNVVDFTVSGTQFKAVTEKRVRTLYFKGKFKGKEVEANFTMDIMDGLENITTVLPFANKPTRYFMTTKQNCMPCAGTFRWGEQVWNFDKKDTFAFLDWGRVNTPYKMVWYWGNGSKVVQGPDGKDHMFGFEITWGIGDESNATETAIFWDGKAHKFGPVDVEVFPKPDKFEEPWHFVSQDGRFDFTMTPFYDHHGDLNVLNLLRMHCHQVHGIWNGTAILDDGTKVEVRDMYAFCEYCENKW